jgi:hypothetical protein
VRIKCAKHRWLISKPAALCQKSQLGTGNSTKTACSIFLTAGKSCCSTVKPRDAARSSSVGKTHIHKPLFEAQANPTLAETYRTIAREGKDGFYKGRIAQAIVDLIQSKGGVMTLEDLAEHTSTPVEPISLKFKDRVVVHEVRMPNLQSTF